MQQYYHIMTLMLLIGQDRNLASPASAAASWDGLITVALFMYGGEGQFKVNKDIFYWLEQDKMLHFDSRCFLLLSVCTVY